MRGDDGDANHGHDQHRHDVEEPGGEAACEILGIANNKGADGRAAADPDAVDESDPCRRAAGDKIEAEAGIVQNARSPQNQPIEVKISPK